MPSPRQRRETCPGCGSKVLVPIDVLETWQLGQMLDGDDYRVRCPNCSAELRTQRKHAGQRAVCPACLYVVTVPCFGPHESEPLVPHDALAALSDSADAPCPSCGTRIPKRARNCPFCHPRF